MVISSGTFRIYSFPRVLASSGWRLNSPRSAQFFPPMDTTLGMGGGERLRRGIQETGENSRKRRWRRAERIVPGLSIRNLGRVGATRTHRARAGLGGGNCGLQVLRNAFTLWFWPPSPPPLRFSDCPAPVLQSLRDYNPSLLPRSPSPSPSATTRPPPPPSPRRLRH